MADDTHYPDLKPDGLGEVDIQLLPELNKKAPKITWGDAYLAWPVEKRLEFAEKLASTMNHAADMLQKERNALIDIAKKQELLIADHVRKYDAQSEMIQLQMVRANEEKQELYVQLDDTMKEKKALMLRIRELERGRND